MGVNEKNAARKKVLYALYEASDATPGGQVELKVVEEMTSLSEGELSSAVRWLISGGYVDGTFHPVAYALTYEGCQEMERIIREAQARKVAKKAKGGPMSDGFNAETKSILFMDVKGWSQLTASEIHGYVTKVMPKLAEHLVEKKAEMVNTWGDAIVATFVGAKPAAEAALSILHLFKSMYDYEGMPNVTPRIALHRGEVVIIYNAITKRGDTFGDGVHRAARLEPVTAPGFVFCTKAFADGLDELKGSAPKALPLGSRELAKGYGTEEVFVVTAARDHDPRPLLSQLHPHNPSEPIASGPPTFEEIGDDSALVMLKGWIGKLPKERHGQAIRYTEVDASEGLPAGTAKRLMGTAVKGLRKIEESGICFIICYDMTPSVSSRPRRDWGGF